MNKQESILLLNGIHPNFFEGEDIRDIPDECIYDEMILSLDEFEPRKYDKTLDDNISFGYYKGDIDELKKTVERVDQHWTQFYDENQRIYCGFVDGKIASFCLIENMGVHNISGRKVKVGGPGCVGTLPEYRNKGIGLIMVKRVTQIFKEEGYDYSYIHYTGVASWYEKLGYKTTIRWTKNGVV